jgi:hypothetical protein
MGRSGTRYTTTCLLFRRFLSNLENYFLRGCKLPRLERSMVMLAPEVRHEFEQLIDR